MQDHTSIVLYSPWVCLKHQGEESFALGSAFRNALERTVLFCCGCCWYLPALYFLLRNSLKSGRFPSTVFSEVLNSPKPSFPPHTIHLFIYTLIQRILTKCILCAKHWGSSDELTRWSLLPVVCRAGTEHVGGIIARDELSEYCL